MKQARITPETDKQVRQPGAQPTLELLNKRCGDAKESAMKMS
jgi:hypothetical protein